ncbi:class I SAM-dependent methyltransferase [Aneurinibacillus uraniidurans]|uniref:class I SAM-dependent methyltransferase n=1 Tax=Aneurinibacillus uraniidurans TaxID=2966586 RepID=UPI00234BB915|nr:class I SAM-dependent methyltransferase [Aneurinibacillus sp. B1]WCN36524.1 class I SAM-dependent methyltransferase [Aneurinibacillus sp. B1]
MIVTTPHEAGAAVIAQAQELARKWDVPFVERRKQPLSRLYVHSPDVLVVTEAGFKAHRQGEARPLFFHPGMAMLRIKRLRSGDTDAMVQAFALMPGDEVLDCTLGLAGDAIVASYAVGASGRVVGLESRSLLARVMTDGLIRYESGIQELDEAMRRIEVRNEQHLTFLAQCEDNSFDIVYFDPMFFVPIEASESISPLRPFADHTPLTEEAVAEAMRVARRRVVMKNHSRSPDFARLGFTRIPKAVERTFTYGIIDTGGDA